MTADQLFQARQADWQALTRLLNQGRGRLGALSPADINELSRLYRATTADLALAQRDFPGHRLTLYLNQLVARAHAFIYQDEPLTLQRLKQYLLIGFPQTFRVNLPFFGAAFLLFLLPALLVGVITYFQPQAVRVLLGAEMEEYVLPLIEQGELWTNIPMAERPYTAAFIMQNNIRVSILAFGGGILAGLLTLYAMIFNGLLVGSLLGLTAHYGIGFDLATFMVGHGVIELTVIFMAGGAGLMMGWAIIRPGLFRRRDALGLAAREAVQLILPAIPLLLIAGLIEGFISPAETIPWPIKWGVGLLTGLVLYSYLLGSGRESQKLRVKN